MTSLIKNQIIKRLSKFVKNLSSKQINLSTLKGEGELSSINLDEKALEDVIELPTWLKIEKATCGRVFIKIPWTHLKTIPIQLQLDDVIIEIETCEKLRNLNNPNDLSGSGNDPVLGKYGFTNRVIDGISLTITNLTFSIKVHGFRGSIFLPCLEIYSIDPNGKRVDTLTSSRLRDTAKNHILLFKEISWANARIEASSSDDNMVGTAIRLIANSCRIRISMKRSLQDSTIVKSRVMIHFDDLLSVVNDAQLKLVLNTYEEITQLINCASEQRKRIAGDKLIKLERQPTTFQPKPSTIGPREPTNPANLLTNKQQFSDLFARYDILETSLHFTVKRFDLHIIADSDVLNDRLAQNGAIQVTLANLSIDHYPYHEFRSSKHHWIKYSEMQSSNRNEWSTRLYEEWQEQLTAAKASVSNDQMSMKLENALRTNCIRLFESCTVVNIDDFVFYSVALNNDKQQKRRRPLITSDKAYNLPETLPIINIQYTEYYYPLPYSFPVPNSDLYIQIMPIVFQLDFVTLSWLDAFISTLSITIDNSGVLKNDQPKADAEHVAIKIEAMLPRIVISSDIFSSADELQQAKAKKNPVLNILQHTEISNQQELEILELNIPKIVITNTRTEVTSNRNKLEQHLKLFNKTNFFQQIEWPFSNESSNTKNTTRISPIFEKHPYETYLYNNPLSKKSSVLLPEPQSNSKALHTYYTMTTDSLKKSAKYDIWHFNVENIYTDFSPLSPSASVQLAKQNMTDTLSMTGWVVLDEQQKDSSLTPWANILCILETPSILKISQKQYTFAMHLVDELGLFIDVLDHTKMRSHLMKQKSSSNNSTDDIKITICLTIPTTFTLAVIDGLEDTPINLPTSNLPQADIEPVKRDTSDANVAIDLLTLPVPIIASTTKVESWMNNIQENNPNKSFHLSGQKKSKFDEKTLRGLEIGSRRPSISTNMNEYNDDTASQWDMTEDLDTVYDPNLFYNDFEEQKVARIQLEDGINLIGKSSTRTTPLGSINGVFIKLNQMNVCITEDEEKIGKPMYVACNVKYLRIDEFSSLKFDKIKPKLFENERPDDFNNENVPPIIIRIDFPKDETLPPPIVTLEMQDRSLSVTIHAIDVISENLEEIQTIEGKIIKKDQPPKLVLVDVHLSNVQLSVEPIPEHTTTKAIVEIKPTMELDIESMQVIRQINGKVTIKKLNYNDNVKEIVPSLSQTNDNLQQLEFLRLENEQLHSELNNQKHEINVLRSERDSLLNTMSKHGAE